MKVKVDGAHQRSTRLAAIGVVARDHHGMVHAGIAQQIPGTHMTKSTKACAFLEGISLAIEKLFRLVGLNHCNFFKEWPTYITVATVDPKEIMDQKTEIYPKVANLDGVHPPVSIHVIDVYH
ncbi:hypothetical protein V6N13_074488 [Hibiscus sabdariffa]|uniref:RNase H type-1 domain-containing protein n=1 Tax=Hibiscus sabdariffa TaxID=183260 RepID=A0ABR2U8J2_9ROSI